MLLLPWWHNRWDRWRDVPVKSGCTTSGGRVQCAPEDMRAKAEQKLIELGARSDYLPLGVYTLARYAASEVGSGSSEEKVAVIEAAINRAKLWNRNVNDLLLYRGSQAGYYGPIHRCEARDPDTGRCTKLSAPYGRWAATSRDPNVDDLLIADFVVKGRAEDFTKGADNQWGPEIETGGSHPVGWGHAAVEKKARESREYWVGPLPGIDHWHTFLFRERKDIDPDSTLGQQLIRQGQAALEQRPTPWRAAKGRAVAYRPDWSRAIVAAPPWEQSRPVQPRGVAVASAIGVVMFALAVSAGIGYLSAFRRSEDRWPWQTAF